MNRQTVTGIAKSSTGMTHKTTLVVDGDTFDRGEHFAFKGSGYARCAATGNIRPLMVFRREYLPAAESTREQLVNAGRALCTKCFGK